MSLMAVEVVWSLLALEVVGTLEGGWKVEDEGAGGGKGRVGGGGGRVGGGVGDDGGI